MRIDDTNKNPMQFNPDSKHGYQAVWKILGDGMDYRFMAYANQAIRLHRGMVEKGKRVSLYSWGYLSIDDNERGWRKVSEETTCFDCRGEIQRWGNGKPALYNGETKPIHCKKCNSTGKIEVA